MAFTISFAFVLHAYAKYQIAQSINIALQDLYLELLSLCLILICAVVIIGCITIYTFGIYFSHRIAGPLIPINRCLDQMLNGESNIPDIKLRETDQLHELAEKINSLKARAVGGEQ